MNITLDKLMQLYGAAQIELALLREENKGLQKRIQILEEKKPKEKK